MREFLDPVNWSRKTRSKYKQHHSIGWDPELNKKEKRGCASGTIPVCLGFPDDTRWPASSYSWDHKISPPQQIVPSNYEPKDKGGGSYNQKKENKNKPVLKMLWCSDSNNKNKKHCSLPHNSDLICGQPADSHTFGHQLTDMRIQKPVLSTQTNCSLHRI